MPYLIDGHNLIGQMRGGLHLGDPDDEAKLILLLRRFCARTRSKATVIFDRGIPGSRKPASSGGLTVRFALPPRTADDEIRGVLKRLGGEARNWIVVSSDRDVRSVARSFGSRTLSGAEFLRHQLSRLSPAADGEKPEPSPDADEIDEWVRLFRTGKGSG
jgi:predicted RNA-binding protein with PIN domain